MSFNKPSKIVQKMLRFRALKFKDGKISLWGIPGLLHAIYINLYVQKLIEKQYGQKDMMDILYNWGKFQATHGFKLMSERFGYAKSLKDKVELLKLNIENADLIGIGKYKWVKIDFKKEIFIMRGKSSIAQEYKKFFGVQKTPVDHYVRGQLTAFIEQAIDKKVLSVETRCLATGNSYCEFVAKPIKKWDNEDKKVKNQTVKRFSSSMKDFGAKIEPYLAASK